MSSEKGNTKKKGGPKHKNGFAFKNNMHNTSEKQKAVIALQVSNVCQRCKDCIEWKIKYKKYKPLTVPGKCVTCSERRVKYAYHILCSDCAIASSKCAKCNQVKEVIGEPEKDRPEQQREEAMLKEELKHMRLREKRTFLRELERDRASGGGVGNNNNKKEQSNNQDSEKEELNSEEESEDETENA